MEKLKNDRRGFSMVELLVVLLILLLVTAVIAGGLPAAQRAHRDVVDESNAQLLLSTVMTRLRDELGTASQVTAAGGIVYYLNSAGGRVLIYGSDGALWLQHSGLIGSSRQPLVADGVRTGGLTVGYDDVLMQNGVITIYGLAVEKDGVELASMPEFCIRVASDS